jgi:predicted RNase H-like nuclease (RuvC/YqgF family)
MKKLKKYVKDLEYLSEELDAIATAYRSEAGDIEYRLSSSKKFSNYKSEEWKKASKLLSLLDSTIYQIEELASDIDNIVSDME